MYVCVYKYIYNVYKCTTLPNLMGVSQTPGVKQEKPKAQSDLISCALLKIARPGVPINSGYHAFPTLFVVANEEKTAKIILDVRGLQDPFTSMWLWSYGAALLAILALVYFCICQGHVFINRFDVACPHRPLVTLCFKWPVSF